MIVWLVGTYFHATFLHITCISNDTSYKYVTINNSCSAIVVAFAPFAVLRGAHARTRHKHINKPFFCTLYPFLSHSLALTPDLKIKIYAHVWIYFYAKMHANESYFRIFGARPTHKVIIRGH